MPHINLLSPAEARKIAAGEVIERPAHIIKEIIENALDASATAITLHLAKAGKQQIRIIDNGCGMDEADAQACFLPHATSKIKGVNDLETVETFGFRGEALTSIAAVSRVTLRTRQAGEQVGREVVYTEDRLISIAPIACPVGTELIIEDLFYNTPARKKFLKQDDTEWNAIQQAVFAFCFSHPGVHFKLYHNGKLTLNAPAVATARDRAAQVWDAQTADHFIPLVSTTQDTLTLTGAISDHQFWRYGKTHQFFFVNNRWVKNAEFSKALVRGYLGILPPERFPGAIIFINTNQAELDVNIHPKKEEVRFSRPGLVFTAIMQAVKATLDAAVTKRFTPASMAEVQLPPLHEAFGMPEKRISSPAVPVQYQTAHHEDGTRSEGPMQAITFPPQRPPTSVHYAPEPLFTGIQQELAPTKPIEQAAEVEYRVLGQLMDTYILCARRDELVIIDQHAAHERILYERRTHYFDEAHGITLLFPEVVTLGPALTTHLMEWQGFFAKQGIQFDALGTHEIAVRTSPPQLRGPALAEVLTSAAHFIAEHGSLDRAAFPMKFNEHVHSHMSCKAAVRSGDTLAPAAMQQLINDLMSVENRFVCVHGRPTMWTIAKSELEKKFRRG